MYKDYDIVIVGAGWYGIHTYKFLKENANIIGKKILILEKSKYFFENSSNYNQNRLHLGYHYPKSFITRQMCLEGYKKFIDNYRDCIDFIDNNYYLISNKSIIDYNTYLQIYDNNVKYDHTIINNSYFKNIEGNIINTKEKIINSSKVKKLFKKYCKNIKFEYEVKNIDKKNDYVIINSEYRCKMLIDCSYNMLNLSNKNTYSYEKTISLIYERINFDLNFESITIMDGEFVSIFPRDISKLLYTLTHVKYTPLIKSNDINDIINYKFDSSKLSDIIFKMEKDTSDYYPDFKKHFKFRDYFISYKCKISNSLNDTRQCNIEDFGNIVSVNCGKITGIFEFEKYLKKKFKIN